MSNQPVSGRMLVGFSLLCGLFVLGVASAASGDNGVYVNGAYEAKLDALEGKADGLGISVDQIEAKADVLEAKIDVLLGIEDTVDLIQQEIIDNACLNNERKPSLYLPPGVGGQLPAVKMRALQTIAAVTATGETTNNAMSKITLGDFYLNAGMFKRAYTAFCQALCLAVSLPNEAPRCSAPPF